MSTQNKDTWWYHRVQFNENTLVVNDVSNYGNNLTEYFSYRYCHNQKPHLKLPEYNKIKENKAMKNE